MLLSPDRDVAVAGGSLSSVTRVSAIIVAALLLLVTLIAARFGDLQGPVIPAFVPICATTWIIADLLTALLLYTQYSVTGALGFLVIASAYTITGLLAIPYLFAFPGVFTEHLEVGQVSVWCWTIWHLLYPLIIGVYFTLDPLLRRRVMTSPSIPQVGLSVMLGSALVAALLATVVLLTYRTLPVLVLSGHFSPAFRYGVAPFIALFDILACVTIIARMGKGSPLHVWLALALLTAALDGALNGISASRYTLSWYVAKLETLISTSVVLIMLLGEISALYRRLATLAGIDPLTGLRNRRSFDEAATLAIATSNRNQWQVAALMIDIDHFKNFNDRYGHAAGDETLKRVGHVLGASLMRASDIVARYGGEEFVALMFDTTRAAAEETAKRICAAVEQMSIPHDNSVGGKHVTVSVGVACHVRGQPIDAARLFSVADAALYNAKRTGRNRFIVTDSSAG